MTEFDKHKWSDIYCSKARCRKCKSPLQYEVGSIMDFHDKEKLCVGCAGEKLAEETIEILTDRLSDDRQSDSKESRCP